MHEKFREALERAAERDFATLRDCFVSAKRNGSDERSAIAAFHYAHNAHSSEDTERDSEWIGKLCNIYRSWLRENPDGLKPPPYFEPEVSVERIRQIIVGQLLYEPPYPDYFRFVSESLSSLGVEFYAPGGSVQRRVWQLLIELFGIEDGEWSEFLYSVRVRAGLDELADEVAARCRNFKYEWANE